MILWLALSCMFALWCHNASEEETSCADAAGSTCLPDTRDKTWEQKKCEQKRFRFNCITVARPHTHTHTHTHTDSSTLAGWLQSHLGARGTWGTFICTWIVFSRSWMTLNFFCFASSNHSLFTLQCFVCTTFTHRAVEAVHCGVQRNATSSDSQFEMTDFRVHFQNSVS